MIVLQILLAFFWMCIVPFFTGCIFTKLLAARRSPDLCLVTGIGLLLQYAVYELFALLFIVLDKSFRLLSRLYAVAALVLAFVGALTLFFCRQRLAELIRESREERKQKAERPDIYLIAAALLIMVQIGAILLWATPDSDDAFYSGLSSMSIAGDYVLKFDAYNGLMKKAIGGRYAISALPVYQATLQLLSKGLHHLFITHNLFPLFYIPLSYGLFACVGRVFCPGDRKGQHCFLFFFALLHLFGNTFVFSPQNFLMTRIWQGKALFICFSLPLFFLLVHGASTADTVRQRVLWGILLIPGMIGTVFMGETGLFLGPLMIVALFLAYATAGKTD